MYQLSEGVWINVELIESMKVDSSSHFIKMASGDIFYISPYDYSTILKLKKAADQLSGQGISV